jgi:hypothetical protein
VQWSINWDGREWAETDATGQHFAFVVLTVGEDSWDVMPTAGPMRLMAWIAAFVAISDGRVDELEQVYAEIAGRPVAEILAALVVD